MSKFFYFIKKLFYCDIPLKTKFFYFAFIFLVNSKVIEGRLVNIGRLSMSNKRRRNYSPKYGTLFYVIYLGLNRYTLYHKQVKMKQN